MTGCVEDEIEVEGSLFLGFCELAEVDPSTCRSVVVEEESMLTS